MKDLNDSIHRPIKTKIGDYYEFTGKRLTDGLASSADILAGRGSRPGNPRQDMRRGDFRGGGSEDVSGVVPVGLLSEKYGEESDAGTPRSFEEEPIFSHAEWKSNDVAFGEKPKEVWNSDSGMPLLQALYTNNFIFTAPNGKKSNLSDLNDSIHRPIKTINSLNLPIWKPYSIIIRQKGNFNALEGVKVLSFLNPVE